MRDEAAFAGDVRENTEKVLRAPLRAVVRDPSLTMTSADGEAALPNARAPGGPAHGAMVSSREIDLATLPASRFARFARVLLRSLQIAFWLSVAALRLPFLRM